MTYAEKRVEILKERIKDEEFRLAEVEENMMFEQLNCFYNMHYSFELVRQRNSVQNTINALRQELANAEAEVRKEQLQQRDR